MKKLFNLFLFAAMLLTVGCKDDDDSLEMSSFAYEVTISGYFQYDAGVDKSDLTSTVMSRVPEGTPVYVDVAYSQFKAESVGNKIYETVTDADGAYSITIPTTSTGIAATIRMQEFQAVCPSYVKTEGGVAIFKEDINNYTKTLDVTALKPGAISFIEEAQVTCASELAVAAADIPSTITLSGSAKLGYETGFRAGAYKSAANLEVYFKVVNTSAEEPYDKTTVYESTVTADGSGNYSVELPIESYSTGLGDGNTLEVSVNGLASSYTHYTSSGVSESLTGAYVKDGMVLSGTNFNEATKWLVEGMKYTMPDLYILFTPNYNSGITTATTPATWTEYLVGWIAPTSSDTTTATVSGKYLLAVETGYAVGAYANEAREAYLEIGSEKDCYYVNTDANGSYSFTIPVSSSSAELSIVAAVSPSMGEESGESPDYTYSGCTFTHYLSSGSTIDVDGAYTEKCTIKDVNAAWNVLGDTYYKFTPKTAPSEWNENLAGWKVAGVLSALYDGTATVSANVWMAVEEAFAVGDYVEADGAFVATLTVSQKVIETTAGDTYGTTKTYTMDYTVPVVGGKVTATVDTISGATDLEVTSFTVTRTSDATFAHYNADGTTTTLYGNYDTQYYWSEDDVEKRAAWNELGDIYYLFTPKEDTFKPTNWASYYVISGTTPYLAGWVKSDYPQLTTPVTGKVMWGVEASYAVGAYEAAGAPFVAKVIVDGEYYVVPVINGEYSVNAYSDKADPSVGYGPIVPLESIDFTHYLSDGTTEDVVVASTNAVDGEISGFDLGTVYVYPYSSDVALTDWSNYLAAWVAPKYDNTKTITGTIRKAVESGFMEGSFDPAAGCKVTITVNSNSFVGVTNTSGNYSIAVGYNDSVNEAKIAMSVAANVGSDYTKYDITGKSEDVEVTYNTIFSSLPAAANANELKWSETSTDVYYTPYAEGVVEYKLLDWFNEYQIASLGSADYSRFTYDFSAEVPNEEITGGVGTYAVEAKWKTYTATAATAVVLSSGTYMTKTSGSDREVTVVEKATGETSKSFRIDNSYNSGNASMDHYADVDPDTGSYTTSTIYGTYTNVELLTYSPLTPFTLNVYRSNFELLDGNNEPTGWAALSTEWTNNLVKTDIN